METTLRMFYARAFGLVLLVLVLLFALLMMAAPAFAQAATAPAQPEQDLIGLMFSTTGGIVGALGAMVYAAFKPPPWLKAIADALTTKEALNWEGVVDRALDRAEAYARTQFDLARDRNGYIDAMAKFMHGYNREVVKWADKDGNGIIDLIQSRLPPGSVTPPKPGAPVLVTPAPRKVTRAKGEALQ